MIVDVIGPSVSRAADIGFTTPPTIGPGRMMATCTVRSSSDAGLTRGNVCIWARRLDLEDAHRVGGADAVVDAIVLEVDAGEIDALAAMLLDQVEAAPRRAESMPRARKSILIMRASSTESLSHWQRKRPSIADCCMRDELDERPRGDDHAADVLGDVPRETGDLLDEPGKVGPERRDPSARSRRAAPSPRGCLSRNGCSLTFARRSSSAAESPSALPTSRMALRSTVGGEDGDEGDMLLAEVLVDARRSVSRGCHAGNRGRYPEPRPSPRSGSDRRKRLLAIGVDVGEADQVADDRADR